MFATKFLSEVSGLIIIVLFSVDNEAKLNVYNSAMYFPWPVPNNFNFNFTLTVDLGQRIRIVFWQFRVATSSEGDQSCG